MISKLKILIIDDDEDDYFLSSQYLEEINSFDVECNWCYSGNDALSKLKENYYDAYFIDYRLGERTGLEIMKQAIDEGCVKPVILLTGRGNEQIDKLAVEYGAYDYLVKDELSSEKLERCLRYSVERYRNFKIINDSEKKYKLLFENAINFIFSCNNILQFQECNAASFSILGYRPAYLKGKSLFDFLSEKDRNELKKAFIQKQNIDNYIVEFISDNKEKVLCNLTLKYFELADENSYWQGIIVDETKRLQIEKANLHKEKLEATYRLVRTLAHEIRNPLTNIGLSLEAIQEDKIESQQPYIDIISRSSKRINTIITDILQSSQTVKLQLALHNICAVVEEALEISSDRIKLKNIVVIHKIPEAPIIKSIDKEKFKIAILNLVVNAIEAMEGETKQLYVSIDQTLDSTEIKIKDTGVGISDANLKSLYEPYFTTKKTGMGLGLISTLNILKSHSAEIKVESEVNIGTTFTISFSNN
jgi:two-component system, sporulation sensor kinase E